MVKYGHGYSDLTFYSWTAILLYGNHCIIFIIEFTMGIIVNYNRGVFEVFEDITSMLQDLTCAT